MPILGLQEYLTEKGHIRTESLAALQNCRVGIQGDSWLRQLTIQDPFHIALGGTPHNLYPTIYLQIEQLRVCRLSRARRSVIPSRIGCQPVFVFNGLPLARDDRPFSKADTRVALRERAWEAISSGEVGKAASMFQSLGTPPRGHLVHCDLKVFSERSPAANFIPNIIKYLHQYQVETFTAPYQARGQLAHFGGMTSQGQLPLLHNVWGPLELLLFNIPTVITDVDFTNGVITWVDYTNVLDDLQLTHDQFLDASILAGFDMISTFPVVSEQAAFQSSALWRIAHDLVKQHGSGFNVIQHYASSPAVASSNYKDQFLRVRAAIEHHVILDRSIKARPLTQNSSAPILSAGSAAQSAPKDIHEIIGSRFPDSIYYLLSQNILSPTIPSSLSSGYFMEFAPMVDSTLYHRLVDELTPLRSITIGLMSSKLHPMLRKKKVVTVRWFEPEKDIVLNHFGPEVEALVSKLNKVTITEDEVRDEERRQNKTHAGELSLHFVTQLVTARKPLPKPAPVDPKKAVDPSLGHKLTGANEVMVNSTLHFLIARGYVATVDDVNVVLTPLGRALAKFTAPFQEHGFTFVDMLVFKVLNSEALVTPAPTGANAKETALISRVFSLLNASYSNSENPWSGPIDKDLTAFNAMVKTLTKALRNLGEMTLARLYFGTDTLKLTDYTSLQRVSDVLPFGQEAGTALGMLVKHKLTPSTIPTSVRFPNCSNIGADLKSGYNFWLQAVEAVKSLHADKIVDDALLKEFAAAGEFLETKTKDVDTFFSSK